MVPALRKFTRRQIRRQYILHKKTDKTARRQIRRQYVLHNVMIAQHRAPNQTWWETDWKAFLKRNKLILESLKIKERDYRAFR